MLKLSQIDFSIPENLSLQFVGWMVMGGAGGKGWRGVPKDTRSPAL